MNDDETKDLFEALARGSDPHTSHAAAANISRKRLGEMHSLTLRVARYKGDKGVTWAEAEEIILAKTGRELVRQSISPRFPELIRLGLMERRFGEDGKELTRRGKLGVRQVINWITPAGLALLKVMGI